MASQMAYRAASGPMYTLTRKQPTRATNASRWRPRRWARMARARTSSGRASTWADMAIDWSTIGFQPISSSGQRGSSPSEGAARRARTSTQMAASSAATRTSLVSTTQVSRLGPAAMASSRSSGRNGGP